jgi:hypothetical protein
MHIFLVVIAVWWTVGAIDNATPILIQEMPNKEICHAIGEALVDMAKDPRYTCVVQPEASL